MGSCSSTAPSSRGLQGARPPWVTQCPLCLQVDEIAQLLNTYLTSTGTQQPPQLQDLATSPASSDPAMLPQGLCPKARPWLHQPPVGPFPS